ncbi:hypothetical protein SDC9_109975 [bioreactor metagenome]|uniref:Uncharacterized protein n=1 Tax=bioreactor metagenome TaxID=1076179 RepID=A0A645BCC3_9ZZZZ
MQARPPGRLLVITLHPLLGIACCHRCNDGAVQPSGEQHPIGNIAHELALDCSFQCCADFPNAATVLLYHVITGPRTGVPLLGLPIRTVVVLARQKQLNGTADPFQGFQLTGHIVATLSIPPLIEGNDADMVTGDEKGLLGSVIQGKGKDSVQLFQEIRALVLIQCKDDFAVTLGQKLIPALIALSDFLVVVDLPIDCQHQITIFAVQRLTS